jgi:hypothetical protein
MWDRYEEPDIWLDEKTTDMFPYKKAALLKEGEILSKITTDIKDFTFTAILKALNFSAEKFLKGNFFSFEPVYSFQAGLKDRYRTTQLLGREKTKAWLALMDKFMDFLKYFYQEKKELITERFQHAQMFEEDMEGGQGQGGNRANKLNLFFKGKELDSVDIDFPTMKLLASHKEFMDLLIAGFDLSRAPKIVDKDEDEGGARYMFLMRENKGEELKKAIEKFTVHFLVQDTQYVKFFIRLANTMIEKDPRKLENIGRTIDYLHKSFTSSTTGKEKFKKVLENDDRLREAFFKITVQLIEIVSKSEYRDKDHVAIRFLVTDTVLSSTPNLPHEYYKKLFATKIEFSKTTYLDYFKNPLITIEDKAESMRYFLNQYTQVPESLSEMIEEFLLNPNTIPSLSLEGLFMVLEGKYQTTPTILDEFIKRLKKCSLHVSVLRGINRILSMRGTNSSKTFLEKNPRHYFVNLYYQVVDFVKNTRQDLLIEYINVPDFLNATLVRYMEPFKDNMQEEFNFGNLITRYHSRLSIIKENLALYIGVLEKNFKYMAEYDFMEPLLEKMKKYRDEINKFTIVHIEKDQDYIDCSCLKDPIWNVYNVCQEYIIYYKELKARCNRGFSFVEYKKSIDDYCEILRKRLISFLDDNVFNLKESYYHFRRLMFKDNIEIYEAAAEKLGLTAPQRKTLFNHARAFHALP